MPLLGSFGAGSAKGFGSSDSGIPVGQVLFTSSASWTVPAGVTNISVVSIGGGAGYRSIDTVRACGGGGLNYVSSLPVTPGQVVTVVVGSGGGLSGPSAGGVSLIQYAGTNYCTANGGSVASAGTIAAGGTGMYPGGSGQASSAGAYGSGGGAAGYTGRGGNGVLTNVSTAGVGGGGGGGYNGAGGGTDVLGAGGSGTARFAIGDGFQGSTGGGQGYVQTRTYGGGGGGTSSGNTYGGNGAVRIIWGPGRAYPATLTLDQPEVTA